MTPPETALLSELAHVKALFQARAIADVIGAPSPAVEMLARNAAKARRLNEESRHDPSE